jgi:hypothetical protein
MFFILFLLIIINCNWAYARWQCLKKLTYKQKVDVDNNKTKHTPHEKNSISYKISYYNTSTMSKVLSHELLLVLTVSCNLIPYNFTASPLSIIINRNMLVRAKTMLKFTTIRKNKQYFRTRHNLECTYMSLNLFMS